MKVSELTRDEQDMLCPRSYLKASPTLRANVCNGCGAAGAKFDFVPDTIYGLSIKAACNPHDWMYYEGKTWHDKFIADMVFFMNILTLVHRKGGLLRWPRRRRALKYYVAVHELGDKAFWAGKQSPPERRGNGRAT